MRKMESFLNLSEKDKREVKALVLGALNEIREIKSHLANKKKLNEEKRRLDEFYDNLTKKENNLGFDVHLYGGDRPEYTPHIHVIPEDGNQYEFEVSILDDRVINVKSLKRNKNADNVRKRAYKNYLKWIKHNRKQLMELWFEKTKDSKHFDKVKELYDKLYGEQDKEQS